MVRVENYFGFKKTPFSDHPDVKQLFASESWNQVSTRLQFLAEHHGAVLLTGEVGAGKSTAARVFTKGLNANLYKILYLHWTSGSSVDLLRQVARELDLEPAHYRGDLVRQIAESIVDLNCSKKQHPILICDEAQLFSHNALEQLPLLLIFNMDSAHYLSLLLVGQPLLRRTLSLQMHEPLRQRIALQYHMDGLSCGELDLYLAQQFKSAGVSQPALDEAARQALYNLTPSVVSLGELLGQHPPVPPPCLVEPGLLPAQGILFVGGEPKIGKSLLVTNLALSLAAGSDRLGFPIMKPSRVLICQFELPVPQFASRLATMRGVLGDAADHNLFIDTPAAGDLLSNSLSWPMPAGSQVGPVNLRSWTALDHQAATGNGRVVFAP